MSPDIERAAELLAGALKSGHRLDALPPECTPREAADAYAIQRALSVRAGPVRGWKVGAPSPDDTPHFAPLLAGAFSESPAEASLNRFGRPELEAEVAFRMGTDLPADGEPLSRAQVFAAVASAHAAIEVVDSRFRKPDAVGALSRLADLQNSGFFVLGGGVADWTGLPLAELPAALELDGRTVAGARGGNPAGEPLWLLVWLANTLAEQGRPLRAGDTVTCGACTGKTPAIAPGNVCARFEGLGTAELRLT